jgi:putative SOS response-associated peptidase YedK
LRRPSTLRNVDGLVLDFPPDYNAAPQSTQPVIVWDEATGTHTLHMMFWRFLPPYVTDPKKFRLDTINARGESRTFPASLRCRRAGDFHSYCRIEQDQKISRSHL